VNVVELEEALFPGGRRTDDFNTKVDELIAAHGRDHIASCWKSLHNWAALRFWPSCATKELSARSCR
jgi:hypothetical protein